MQQDNIRSDISHDQLSLAARLGIQVSEQDQLDQLIKKIESELGQNTMLEQARYFVMSVYNHAGRLKWSALSDNEFSEARQYELASLYIASDEFKQSLRTVLKENRFKFTFLKFAKSRDVEKRVLSTTTKAYKQAKTILVEQDLVKLRSTKAALSANRSTDSGSLVDRRAARRGYFDEVEFDDSTIASAIACVGDQANDMSDEEFAELDAKLSSVDSLVMDSWNSGVSEDRFSLLVGLAAGGAVFAAILWVLI